MDLVGGWPTPLKNMSWSIGMMTLPIYGKIKNVPNHQPVIDTMVVDHYSHWSYMIKKRIIIKVVQKIQENWHWISPISGDLSSRLRESANRQYENHLEDGASLRQLLYISWWTCPLVNVYITVEKKHHFQWENPLYMAIFSSYVKLQRVTPIGEIGLIANIIYWSND